MADIFNLVRQHAARDPTAIAILAPGRAPLTYSDLARQIEAVVARLNTLGIGRNDRVALALPEGPELAVALLGIGAGAACAPLQSALRVRELEFALADMRTVTLVVPAASASPAVDVARARGVTVLELSVAPGAAAGIFTLSGPARSPPARPGLAASDDTMLALHTSGTTSRPKLVPLTHRNVAASARAIAAVLGLGPRDRCLNVMPLVHIHGQSTIYASLAAGGSVVCTSGLSTSFPDWLEEFGPTWYTAAPAIHRLVLAEALRRPELAARSTLRFIRSASSAMPRELIADMERVFGVPFVEAYGMTEAAPQVASNRLPPATAKPGSVGRAAGPEVAIMDATGDLLPPGATGEVVIRGANVMSGYDEGQGRDETAFTRGWFRTGDTGWLDAEGDLFITGRLKEIVNRGGEKISPREVDEVLLEHPAVAQAVAFAVPHATLGESVAAAVVLRAGARATAEEILAYAATRLAPFKLPQPIVITDAIPADSAGKPQRIGLAGRLGLVHAVITGDGEASPLETKIGAILAGVLGLPAIGRHDNFFHLGGHSLAATRAAARIAEELGIEPSFADLFERPTAALLANAVTSRLGRRPSPAIPRRDAAGPCVLSFAQQRLWLLDRLEPGNPAYTMQVVLRLGGALDLAALEDSLGEIHRRHESLRTTFASVDGEAVQVIHPPTPLRLPVIGLERLPPGERLAEARRVAAGQAREPFHLEHGPLFRALLVRLDAREHVLVLTMHHIVSDGWSNAVLLGELGTLYRAFAAGEPANLPELPIQYADFADWQRQRLADGPALAAELAWWREQLRDVPPVLDLPCDRRPAVQSWRGSRHEALIEPALVARLQSLAGEAGATLFMTLLAAFQALLWRYTGQERFAVGTAIANRTRVATERLIGFFANTLALPADLSGDPSFRVALGRVRSTAIGAYAHQELPFEKLVDELQPERHADRTPLVQVMFAFQEDTEAPAELAPGLAVERLPVGNETAKFDLTLYPAPTARGIELAWQYNSDLFERPTIERMAAHFQALLAAVVAQPDQRLSRVPLVDGAEARGSPAWSSDTSAEIGAVSFGQLFAAAVLASPEAVALRCGAEQLSYRELDTRADRLAHRLRQHGVEPGTLVAVCLPRSVSMPVALLGVLKAGAAFVPIDPEYPAGRIAFMLTDTRAPVIVTDESLRARLPGTNAAIVCIEAADDRRAISNPTPDPDANSLAYVIYTSGSTGSPKGVMITRANLCHYVQALRSALGITATDRYLHTAPFSFSSSVRQLLLPLSCGATVVIATSEEIRDPLALFETVRREGVSVIDLVPSYLRVATTILADLAADARGALLDNRLRLILSASETLHPDLPWRWSAELRPGARLVNMYGQTETTGIVTVCPVPPGEASATQSVPVGRPIAGARVVVLDGAREPVPTGVPGEIWVGGATVGRGYLDDAVTTDHFVPDPFDATPGARLYRTGDRGRIRSDGQLEHLGRVDDQVKVRGFRIEPTEIESALNAHPAVLESVVVTDATGTGGRRLVAGVVRRGGRAGGADADGTLPFARLLREYLKARLPEYMVPAAIVELTALPRTTSGKVDRKTALPVDGGRAEAAETPATPATHPMPAEEILERIWREALRVERVRRDDNFFDLGGDSIVGLHMIERANAAGLRLSPRQLFQHQTLGELARAAVAAVGPTAAHPGPAPGPPGVAPDTAADEETPPVRVTLESIRAFGREALERSGLSAGHAAAMTEVQVEASLRGQPTHNVGAIPRYARRIATGATNPRPRFRIERETPTSALIDGDNGPGQLVAVMAMELAIRKARESGVCVVGARRSNHFGAAGHYAWLAARENLVGLCTTNSALWLAPTGGVTPLFGTNPLGVGIPSARHDPIVLDVSMSVTAKGKVALHLAEGRPLPPGWILDRAGRPSIDAADLAAGLGVPIGGHKGYGLVLVMEVLSGVLTGAAFSADHRRERLRRPDVPADFGHFFMAIDPALFMPLDEFTGRVDRMIAQVKASAKDGQVGEILLPGEREMRQRSRNLHEGVVPIPPNNWRALQEHRAAAGLATELVAIEPALPFTRADLGQTIPARFEAVARRFADRLALSGDGRRWTYRELDARANRIAHAIGSLTPRGPGAVAYLLGQSPEMVIATLAILKAGKTYLAIHPRMPLRAQAEIVRDIAPDLLLTTTEFAPGARELAAGACAVLTLEEIDERFPDTTPPARTKPEDPSTIFYTSGTTRQAKGVIKSHRAVLHRAWLASQHDRVVPGDRQSLLTHASFSASESDMFGALLQGASVHVFDILAKGLSAFRDWLEQERITLLHPPVLFFRRFLATLEGESLFPAVRIVALAGDVVLPADLKKWRQHFARSCVLLHRFSITETALLTVARFDRDTPLDEDVVDAGFPVADKALVLVDEHGEPVPRGETGELVVRSAYLSDGYWRRPEDTAAAFTTIDAATGERAYHTGDQGRFLEDGRFVFLGRLDHQVKIRGYRVDIREIEAALQQLDEVAESAVVVRWDNGEARLVAFVVPKPEWRFDPVALRSGLRTRLPEWKIPAEFSAIGSLPTTSTGKVDRRRLVEKA